MAEAAEHRQPEAVIPQVEEELALALLGEMEISSRDVEGALREVVSS